jgi:hypothetical protein
MNRFWIKTGQQTISGYLHFLPAIIIAWLVAGVAGGEVPAAPQVAQTGLLIICLSFYSAAAARAHGVIDTSSTGHGMRESTLWLGMSRTGIEIEPILISLLMLLIVGVGFIGGMLAAQETGAAIGLGAAALLCVLIMSRIWAVFSVPFFFRGKYRWSPAGGGLIWSGPALGMAMQLSRLPMAKKLATPTFMVPLLVLLLPLLTTRLYLGPHFLLSLLFYAVVLPYLSMLNLGLTAQLLKKNQRQLNLRQ